MYSVTFTMHVCTCAPVCVGAGTEWDSVPLLFYMKWSIMAVFTYVSYRLSVVPPTSSPTSFLGLHPCLTYCIVICWLRWKWMTVIVCCFIEAFVLCWARLAVDMSSSSSSAFSNPLEVTNISFDYRTGEEQEEEEDTSSAFDSESDLAELQDNLKHLSLRKKTSYR